MSISIPRLQYLLFKVFLHTQKAVPFLLDGVIEVECLMVQAAAAFTSNHTFRCHLLHPFQEFTCMLPVTIPSYDLDGLIL